MVTASRTRNRVVGALRNATFGYGMLAGALPDFLLGLVLIFVFFTHLDLLPGPEGRLGILDIGPPSVTGSILIDTILAGDSQTFWSAVAHLVLPVFTLAFVYGAPIFKMLRSQMEIALMSDFTVYAEALGLRPRTVFLRAAQLAASGVDPLDTEIRAGAAAHAAIEDRSAQGKIVVDIEQAYRRWL